MAGLCSNPRVIRFREASKIEAHSHILTVTDDDDRIRMYIQCDKRAASNDIRGVNIYGVELFYSTGLAPMAGSSNISSHGEGIGVIEMEQNCRAYVNVTGNSAAPIKFSVEDSGLVDNMPAFKIVNLCNRTEVGEISLDSESVTVDLELQPDVQKRCEMVLTVLAVKFVHNIYQTGNLLIPKTRVYKTKSIDCPYVRLSPWIPPALPQPSDLDNFSSSCGLVIKAAGYNEQSCIQYHDVMDRVSANTLAIFECSFRNEQLFTSAVCKDIFGRNLFTLEVKSIQKNEFRIAHLGYFKGLVFFDYQHVELQMYLVEVDSDSHDQYELFKYDIYAPAYEKLASVSKAGCMVEIKLHEALKGDRLALLSSFALCASINSYKQHILPIPRPVKYVYNTRPDSNHVELF